MSGKPDWLPEPLSLSSWSAQTYDQLYKWFQVEILAQPLLYGGKGVWHFSDMEDGRECLFWHLTCRKDNLTNERIPDLQRCRRLPWLRPLLLNADEPEVLDWDYAEGDGTTKTYVWLRDHDYLVIMKKYPDGSRRLVTAYWIEYEHEKAKLLKKHKRRLSP
jgi:hypothetical protein